MIKKLFFIAMLLSVACEPMRGPVIVSRGRRSPYTKPIIEKQKTYEFQSDSKIDKNSVIVSVKKNYFCRDLTSYPRIADFTTKYSLSENGNKSQTVFSTLGIAGGLIGAAALIKECRTNQDLPCTDSQKQTQTGAGIAAISIGIVSIFAVAATAGRTSDHHETKQIAPVLVVGEWVPCGFEVPKAVSLNVVGNNLTSKTNNGVAVFDLSKINESEINNNSVAKIEVESKNIGSVDLTKLDAVINFRFELFKKDQEAKATELANIEKERVEKQRREESLRKEAEAAQAAIDKRQLKHKKLLNMVCSISHVYDLIEEATTCADDDWYCKVQKRRGKTIPDTIEIKNHKFILKMLTGEYLKLTKKYFNLKDWKVESSYKCSIETGTVNCIYSEPKSISCSCDRSGDEIYKCTTDMSPEQISKFEDSYKF